jgi:PKD repeat protein
MKGEDRMNRNRTRALFLMLIILSTLGLTMLSSQTLITKGSPGLTITASPTSQVYFLRQKPTISGTITLDGSPATNLVIAVEVTSPSQNTPISYRTIQLGTPNQAWWQANITDLFIQDMSSNPIDTIKIGSKLQVGMTVQNIMGNTITAYVTATIYDANMVPIEALKGSCTLGPLQAATFKWGEDGEIQIPTSATSGAAQIIGCVYSQEPRNEGKPYCPEDVYYYQISKTQTGLLGIPQLPVPPPQNTPGAYTISYTLPTDPIPGTYSVYLLGQASPTQVMFTTTAFNVQSSTGIPPQASFAYWPTSPTVNTTTNFDASSSTPEGYGDYIKEYDWNFGDGTPDYITTGNPADPTASHTFVESKTYIVTLNVTNSENLWCITSKPVNVGLGYGPTANFTWFPANPVINDTVTFNASTSTPGQNSQLVNYTWSFSDGTGSYTVTTPTTTHIFTQPGNYTVALTVLDNLGRTSSTSALVQVQNATVKLYDPCHDGKIDGNDLILVAWCFGSWATQPPPSRYNPACDFMGTGTINGDDLILVARHFGEDP